MFRKIVALERKEEKNFFFDEKNTRIFSQTWKNFHKRLSWHIKNLAEEIINFIAEAKQKTRILCKKFPSDTFLSYYKILCECFRFVWYKWKWRYAKIMLWFLLHHLCVCFWTWMACNLKVKAFLHYNSSGNIWLPFCWNIEKLKFHSNCFCCRPLLI